MNKYADKPQGLSHTLDGVWQSIQNSGKSGVREWVEKIRNAANVARNLEKRNRELETALRKAVLYLDHPDVKEIPFACPTEQVAKNINELLSQSEAQS